MRETSENPTIALSSSKADRLLPKSWGVHIGDTHSHCVFHFILYLVVSCVTSIYPCETRLNGQVKCKCRKMATRVQVRPHSGRKRSLTCYAVQSRILSKTHINKHPARHQTSAHLSKCDIASVKSG